jgi:phosphinothricin acetyltransferase
MDEIAVRPAELSDAEAIQEIYAPYVRETAITFDYEVPTVAELREHLQTIRKMYPFLAAELDGRIAGYAYAGPFKDREAYCHSAETSIYVRQNLRGKGIGRALLEQLERQMRCQGILNACACIAYTEKENAHLTNDSVHFHERMGYRLAAHFTKCGYKFGSWYDMVWMEKMLGEHTETVPEFIPAGRFL